MIFEQSLRYRVVCEDRRLFVTFQCIGQLTPIAAHTVQQHAQLFLATLVRGNPLPYCKRRVVSDVLAVTTIEFRNPVVLVILVVACNAAFHFQACVTPRPRPPSTSSTAPVVHLALTR